MEENENLKQDLEKNPDEKENIIIGKAKDVKSRIKSKFSPSKKMRDSENTSSDEEEQPEKKLKDKRKKLDIELENAVNSYNSTYALLQDHGRFINELIENINLFFDILENAFAPDIRMAFNGSIELAKLSGVPSEEILDSKEKIARYFLA